MRSAAKNVAYKRRHSRLWATAQPRLSYVWTDPRTKTDQARVRFGATVDRGCHGLARKGRAWLAVKYRDRFSFQGSRSLVPLRLRHLIPLDRDAAPMPVARARVGSQFHRQSWQTGPTPASGVDDRYQPHAPPQMTGRWSSPVSTESLEAAASRSRCLKVLSRSRAKMTRCPCRRARPSPTR